MITNSQIAEVFENVADLLELKGESVFTVRAYQKAARAIERLPVQLEQMVRNGQDLQEIPGIGKAISDKIKELVNTGKLGYYERLKGEFPDGMLELMQIPGLGPRTASRLWKELDITTVEELEEAARDGRIAALPRMGKKTAENILRQIEFHRIKGQRIPIARAMPLAQRVIADLQERCPGVQHLMAAGSLRRFKETVGDIDLVAATDGPQQVTDALVGLPDVAEVLGHGDTKASVILKDGLQIDIRVVLPRQFGALLQHFTGNKQHNIQLRDYANQMGLSLSEYGITDMETGRLEEFEDEGSFYERLGLQWMPPEIRQGMNEIELARKNRIPRLVEVGDIRGDLHDHTDWSDGRDSMEQMVAAAKERGLEYIAITDHSVGRAIANGLSVQRLKEYVKELREVEKRVGGIKVLCGTEMDIRADGSLDYADDVLKELDWVVASIHSAMNQDEHTMTERIIRAMRNPYVHAIGHLSTRIIGTRQPINADYEAIFKAAAETGTVLEINGSPERLDLKDTHVYRARELGVPLVISTDAHMVEALDNVHYGAAVARRGWCEPRHILNTLPLKEFLNFLSLEKSARVKAFSSYA